jgi:hypothetical protein
MFSSMAAFSFRLNVSQIVLISIWSFSILSISTHILVISLSILSQFALEYRFYLKENDVEGSKTE